MEGRGRQRGHWRRCAPSATTSASSPPSRASAPPAARRAARRAAQLEVLARQAPPASVPLRCTPAPARRRRAPVAAAPARQYEPSEGARTAIASTLPIGSADERSSSGGCWRTRGAARRARRRRAQRRAATPRPPSRSAPPRRAPPRRAEQLAPVKPSSAAALGYSWCASTARLGADEAASRPRGGGARSPCPARGAPPLGRRRRHVLLERRRLAVHRLVGAAGVRAAARSAATPAARRLLGRAEELAATVPSSRATTCCRRVWRAILSVWRNSQQGWTHWRKLQAAGHAQMGSFQAAGVSCDARRRSGSSVADDRPTTPTPMKLPTTTAKTLLLVRHGITEMNVNLGTSGYGTPGFVEPGKWDTRLADGNEPEICAERCATSRSTCSCPRHSRARSRRPIWRSATTRPRFRGLRGSSPGAAGCRHVRPTRIGA